MNSLNSPSLTVDNLIDSLIRPHHPFPLLAAKLHISTIIRINLIIWIWLSAINGYFDAFHIFAPLFNCIDNY
jgi:hypothetical protein